MNQQKRTPPADKMYHVCVKGRTAGALRTYKPAYRTLERAREKCARMTPEHKGLMIYIFEWGKLPVFVENWIPPDTTNKGGAPTKRVPKYSDVDIRKGAVFMAPNQGTNITPQTIKVTVYHVSAHLSKGTVHYQKENDPTVYDTTMARFLTIINQ